MSKRGAGIWYQVMRCAILPICSTHMHTRALAAWAFVSANENEEKSVEFRMSRIRVWRGVPKEGETQSYRVAGSSFS